MSPKRAFEIAAIAEKNAARVNEERDLFLTEEDQIALELGDRILHRRFSFVMALSVSSALLILAIIFALVAKFSDGFVLGALAAVIFCGIGFIYALIVGADLFEMAKRYEPACDDPICDRPIRFGGRFNAPA